MSLLTHDFASALMGAQPPCLSLYQPTHRCHPANQQDPIRFRNLVKALEHSLLQQYPQTEIASLLAPFESLANDQEHWNHTLDGLAVFSAPGLFKVFATQRPVKELVVVANSFHTKPLRRLLQRVSKNPFLVTTGITVNPPTLYRSRNFAPARGRSSNPSITHGSRRSPKRSGKPVPRGWAVTISPRLRRRQRPVASRRS